MYLTLSKRFEFSSSLRQYISTWDEATNLATFGRKSVGPYGHGYNLVAFVVFSGAIDPATGMVINVTDIKREVNAILDDRYDHKFLNLDCPVFRDIVPTPEMIASHLLADVQLAFRDHPAQPVACHLQESPVTSGTAYSNGSVERHFSLAFSAARQTCSPNLSQKENQALFGAASDPSGHGHGYHLLVTIGAPVDSVSGLIMPEETTGRCLEAVRSDFDHKNLNVDRRELKHLPMTTEVLAHHLHDRLNADLPMARVRLHENDWFFAEYHKGGDYQMGLSDHFHAAHRLHSQALSDKENREVYGKCNNPNGHGHRYEVEATIGGNFDARSGTLYPLDKAIAALQEVTSAWDRVHLNKEIDEFRAMPSTGENIISVLWPRADAALENRLARLRLWETPNNRFTVRREPPLRD